MTTALIERFYGSLSAKDGVAMAECYAADATFEDPAFGRFDAEDAGAMWRMLTSRAGDLTVEVSEITADDKTGSVRWIARYTFTRTGRPGPAVPYSSGAARAANDAKSGWTAGHGSSLSRGSQSAASFDSARSFV